MKSILLNKWQNTLLKFQQKDVIESSSESSEFEGGDMNIVSLIKHQNKTISNLYSNKIRNSIEEYKKKELKLIDKKILKGIIRMNRFEDNSLSSDDNPDNEYDLPAVDKSSASHITPNIRK